MQVHRCKDEDSCSLGRFYRKHRMAFLLKQQNCDVLLKQFVKGKHRLRVGRGRRTDGQIARQADRVTESDSFPTPLLKYSIGKGNETQKERDDIKDKKKNK